MAQQQAKHGFRYCPTRLIKTNQNLLPYMEKASEGGGSRSLSQIAKYHEGTIYTWFLILCYSVLNMSYSLDQPNRKKLEGK